MPWVRVRLARRLSCVRVRLARRHTWDLRRAALSKFSFMARRAFSEDSGST